MSLPLDDLVQFVYNQTVADKIKNEQRERVVVMNEDTRIDGWLMPQSIHCNKVCGIPIVFNDNCPVDTAYIIFEKDYGRIANWRISG